MIIASSLQPTQALFIAYLSLEVTFSVWDVVQGDSGGI